MSAKCQVCGNPRRSGTGGRATYVDPAGSQRTVIACAKCIGRALVIVTAPPAVERVIEQDDADVRKVLRGLARHLRQLAKLDETEGEVAIWTHRDGLEQAADFAEAWANERAARKTLPEICPFKVQERRGIAPIANYPCVLPFGHTGVCRSGEPLL